MFPVDNFMLSYRNIIFNFDQYQIGTSIILTMEIQEIKQRLSILTVLNHYNLEPDKHQMLKYPFHEDYQPSLKIYTDQHL